MERNYKEEQKYEKARKRVKQVKGFYVHLLVYVLVNLFLLLSGAISSGNWEAFAYWHSYTTAIFWGIGVAFHALNVFGVNIFLGENWEERKIKEMMDKDKRDMWE